MDHNSKTERDYERSSSGDVVTKIQYSKSFKYSSLNQLGQKTEGIFAGKDGKTC